MNNWKMFLIGLIVTILALVMEAVNVVNIFKGTSSDAVGLIGVLFAGIGIYVCLKGVYN